MQILTLLKTSAQNNEQKIFKLILFIILPLMAGLTVYSFIAIHAKKYEAAVNLINTKSGNANKRIAIFLDPVIRDIGYLQQRGVTADKLNPQKPNDVCEFLSQFSKFYLQHIRQIIFWDGQYASVYKFNNGICAEPENTSNPPYEEFLKKIWELASPDKIERDFGTFNPESNHSSILAATIFMEPDSNSRYTLALDIDSTVFFEGLEDYMNHLLFTASDAPKSFPQQFLKMDNGEPNIIATNDPVIIKAFTEWRNNPIEESAVFPLMYDGKPWWVSIRYLDIKSRIGPTYSGLIIPESELLADWISKWRIFTLISSISFGVVLIAAIFLWRRYLHDIQQAARAPVLNRMSDEKLLTTIAAGENDRLEFKSTLRWNLKSNKPDKAMEVACLKTIAAFLNSEGGSLLVGVEDDGNIIGIASDQFPNEDKFMLHFNNLINQHLGSDNTEYFSFNIRHMSSGDILIVDCQSSTDPVFLKYQNNDDFYVRVGPGTRLLTSAETLDYVQNHFRE